jgi:protease I
MSGARLEGMKVLVLTETEFIPGEMAYYRDNFPRLGASVDFATNLWGQPSRTIVSDVTEPNEQSQTMQVNLDVGNLRYSDYDIIIQSANYTAVRLREIPPMHSHGSVAQTRDAPAVKLFADAMRDKRIIKAAMCHGLWILTPCPELLIGRRVMCHTVVLADINNAGAVYVPNEGEVIVDDDLVTARSFANVEGYFLAIVAAAEEPLRRTRS